MLQSWCIPFNADDRSAGVTADSARFILVQASHEAKNFPVSDNHRARQPGDCRSTVVSDRSLKVGFIDEPLPANAVGANRPVLTKSSDRSGTGLMYFRELGDSVHFSGSVGNWLCHWRGCLVVFLGRLASMALEGQKRQIGHLYFSIAAGGCM